MKKWKSVWKSGKIERSFRITYDVVWNVLLFFIVIGFISLFLGLGIGAGYFASLVKDEPVLDYETMKKDIYNSEETSKMYFANNIYLADVRSDLHREKIALDEIADTLIHAVIATEDEYFNEHKGVVPRAIVRAIVQEATNSDTKSGGSTLTQQLVKNQILTNEVSFERKAKEILLALRLERYFSKEEIMEAYLNIIPYGREASGRNIAGIQTAAKGIFGIDAADLNLPQAAFLAGLPQNPYRYTPFANGGGLKDKKGLEPGLNRMKTVLKRMHVEGYITEKEYNKALKYDIVADFIKPKKISVEKYGYLKDEIDREAREIIKLKLAEEDGHTEKDLKKDVDLNNKYAELAARAIRQNGYRIHSTVDKKIYDAFQEVVKKYPYFGPDRVKIDPETGKEEPDPVRTGAVLLENSTGKIISFVGGRGYSLESEKGQFNFATQTERQTGSTIKPLLDYAPAMEKGIVQPGTAIADINPANLPVPRYPAGKPRNYGGGYHGIVSVREALVHSDNVPAARTYAKIIDDNPVKNYLEKMGMDNLDPDDYENSSMSLGGMKRGISVAQNTNAFVTLGNNGKFNKYTVIDKITTRDGKVIYEHKPKPVDVFTPQTTYLTLDMMRDVINYGTAGSLKSYLKHSGVDWAGKTGTTNDYKDAWFVATNPNVTFGTWIGYDSGKSLDYCPGCSLSYSKRNLKLWAELINVATDINPDLLAPKKRFKQPEGIVSRSYCAISGLAPSELCAKAGLVKSDLFNVKYVPTQKDDSLISGSFVTVNGKAVAAGPNTPKEFINGSGSGFAFNPEFLKRHGYDRLGDLSLLYSTRQRGAWEKIGLPKGKAGSPIKDDGKAPAAPTSVSFSGGKLTWNKPASGQIVGYRIYRAQTSGGSFQRVGSTTDTSYSISSSSAVYIVKAVDYFGRESAGSKEVIAGNAKEKRDSAKKEKNKDPAPKNKVNDGNNKEKKQDKKNNNKDNDKQHEDEQNKQSDNKNDHNDKPKNSSDKDE